MKDMGDSRDRVSPHANAGRTIKARCRHKVALCLSATCAIVDRSMEAATSPQLFLLDRVLQSVHNWLVGVLEQLRSKRMTPNSAQDEPARAAVSG
jgi:hypothetical protein